MKYKLPNGEVIDLKEYGLEDCILVEDEKIDEKELERLLLEKQGILLG